MHSGLSETEIGIVERAERRQRMWRYGRWVQLTAGLLFIGAGFLLDGNRQDATLVLGIIHPFILVILGAALAGESLHNRAAKERSVLLKLARSSSDSAI